MARPQQLPPDDDQSFGARLIRYRLKNNLSRKDLVERMSVVAPIQEKAVQRWEIEGKLPRDPRHYQWIISRLQRAGL